MSTVNEKYGHESEIGGGDIKRSVPTLLAFLIIVGFAQGEATLRAETSPNNGSPAARRNFSFGYWLNGWRKSPQDTSADILCIESGYFGFMLDVDDLANARFGLLDDNLDYGQALEEGARRLQSLPPAHLAIELAVDGKVYRAVTCKAGTDTNVKRLSSARLWESGRLVQHFDLLELHFEDEAGVPLPCDGTLDLVAWLGVHDAEGNKLAFTEMKTAYLTHGPCLTEVRYNGCYGPQREVDLAATVRTLRTDDYARTFHTLAYAFRKELSAGSGGLFKMGRTGRLVTPQIAYGNGTGLIAEHSVPLNLKPAELFVDKVTLSGEGPWWVAFPGAIHTTGKDWGTGSRALVIRSYRAVFDGKTFNSPTISMPVHKVQRDGRCDLDLLLVPPEGVKEFRPGDTVEMDLQWITLPRVADDYYGPNEAFRTHLAANPCSWKTVYREARGNDLDVTVDGGVVSSTYPIIIQTEQPEIKVDIRGGVGAVPVRFDGLETASGYILYQDVDGQLMPLDQSVHGNDYWQTAYDAGVGTYQMSFNLPLDDKESSKWMLKQTKSAD